MPRIEVVAKDALKSSDATPGIARRSAFQHGSLALGQSTIGPSVVSDWHHHGTRALYGILLSGRLRFDFGSAGRESVTVGPGDFFHIPAGLVHRDANPDREHPAIAASVLLGEGASVVNVAGPDP
jgi:uncharacterized RmlC-like cupin family protein